MGHELAAIDNSGELPSRDEAAAIAGNQGRGRRSLVDVYNWRRTQTRRNRTWLDSRIEPIPIAFDEGGAMHVVDLSHPMTDGMVTSQPLPGPQTSEYLSFDRSREHYAEGTEFCIGRVTMLSATGTYLDAPYHRYRHGDDVAALPLARCVGLRVVIVPAQGSSVIGPDALTHEFRDAAVLFHTGWDAHWGADTYSSIQHPHLTEDCAHALVDGGATLVGVDSVNVDDTSGASRPVHSTLLAAGIPIVENLTNLRCLVGGELFFAAPLAFVGMPSFPVRAHALQDTAADPRLAS